MHSRRTFWCLMALAASTMWGISGLFAKALFNLSPAITPMWISQVRMITSGVILLVVATIFHQHPMAIWHRKKDALAITAYGLLAMLPVQYCYFVAVQLGNASIATILQFVGPFFILAYTTIFRHQRPRRVELVGAVIAFSGVVILATHGHLNQLAISTAVLFWGLLSALGVATSNLIPQGLVHHFPSVVINGWGLLLSGIALLLVHPQSPHLPHNSFVFWGMAAVILIGTLIPFQLITMALKVVPASIVSLMDAAEPLSATIGSVIVFNLILMPADWVGSLLIICAVLALSIHKPSPIEKNSFNKHS